MKNSAAATGSRRPVAYLPAIFRVGVGVTVVVGGVLHILRQAEAMLLLETIGLDIIAPTILIPFIIIIQLVAGTMLTTGLLTRAAAAALLILFAFFFFAHELRTDLPGVHFPLFVDIFLFAGLIFLAYRGAPGFSIDQYLRERQLEAISEAVQEPATEGDSAVQSDRNSQEY